MLGIEFKKVRIAGYAFEEAPNEVTSVELEQRLAPLYAKIGIPLGTLEKLSGVVSRRTYGLDDCPSNISTRAALKAFSRSSISKEDIGVCFNCSVTRDFFEPATGVIVHNNLGLPETAMAMDITNACIGFSNGMLMAANLIESGVIKAGLITTGEHLGPITDSTLELLLKDEVHGRERLMGMLATFTLGSGGAAMILCHEDLAPEGPRIKASVSRSASQHKDLCMGNGDFCFHQRRDLLNPLMETESRKLIASAALLGQRVWKEARGFFNWSEAEIDHIFCHQVGKHVNEAFYNTIGLPYEKEHTVYQKYGNLVSGALPSVWFTKADEGVIARGDKVLLMGFGSGLNAIFTAVEW